MTLIRRLLASFAAFVLLGAALSCPAAPSGAVPASQRGSAGVVEHVAISLRELDRTLAALQAAGRSVPRDIATLGGGTWPVGFIETGDGDVTLILLRHPRRPSMKLDELLTLYRNALLQVSGRGQAPFCSLDPQEASVRAVDRLRADPTLFRRPEDASRFAHLLEQAWNAKGQQVRTGGAGISPHSVVSHRCITADYLMKAQTQCRESLAGFSCLLDRYIDVVKRGDPRVALPADAASRLWFLVEDKRMPAFDVDGSTITLAELDVSIASKRQVADRSGRMQDATTGGEDAIVQATARDLSRMMAAHPDTGPYASWDQAYRMLALMQAIVFRRSLDPAQVPFLTQLQAEIDARPMPDSLPGLVNLKSYVNTVDTAKGRATQYYFPMVMGGGDMSMTVRATSFSRAPSAGPGEALRRQAFAARPGDRAAYWVY